MDSLDLTESWHDDLRIPELGGERIVEPALQDIESKSSESDPSDRIQITTPTDETYEANSPPKVCLAFRGINGGVGTTTIAIETAHVLSGSRRGSVCLVDLDFELGTIHHYLDATIQPRIEDLQADPARLDAQFVRARLFHQEAGFAVFAPTGKMGGNDEVNARCVLAVLDTLGEMFDVLVLDVPRLTRPWTQAALMASDITCLVGELTIPSLHVCRQRMEEVTSLGAQRVEVVLSKYERRSFRASLRTGDAERALGRSVIGEIASDPHTAHDALNCAVPVGISSRDSRMTKDIGALSRVLSPHYAERRRRPR